MNRAEKIKICQDASIQWHIENCVRQSTSIIRILERPREGEQKQFCHRCQVWKYEDQMCRVAQWGGLPGNPEL